MIRLEKEIGIKEENNHTLQHKIIITITTTSFSKLQYSNIPAINNQLNLSSSKTKTLKMEM